MKKNNSMSTTDNNKLIVGRLYRVYERSVVTGLRFPSVLCFRFYGRNSNGYLLLQPNGELSSKQVVLYLGEEKSTHPSVSVENYIHKSIHMLLVMDQVLCIWNDHSVIFEPIET